MTIEEYMKLMLDAHGDPINFTQHLLGSSNIQKLSSTRIRVTHLCHVVHLRIQNNPRREGPKFTAYGTQEFIFDKIDNAWKISGFRPVAEFVEGRMSDLIQTTHGN